MLSVKELKTLAAHLSAEDFRKQLGPFVLVQKPPIEVLGAGDNAEFQLQLQRTTVAKTSTMSAAALGLLFQFDDLAVATVPPLHGIDELSVGRQPDSDLILEDPSVSKTHALLRWDASSQKCTVQDLGSTNGTFLNASVPVEQETALANGDIISFGEVQYWFLLTPTLREKLLHAKSRGIGV